MPETDLYLPVKRLFEGQGYAVKSEVHACDVVAVRGDEAPVIVELKAAISIKLLCQAVDRLMLTDHVYVAVARPPRGVSGSALKLCKRLGLGLIIVSGSGSVDVLADPLPYQPRKNVARRGLLLREFSRREGDPNTGGSSKRKLMTSYRQDALRCLSYLFREGFARVRDIKSATGVARAAALLRDNHYNWFQREARGVYGLSAAGLAAVSDYREHISALQQAA